MASVSKTAVSSSKSVVGSVSKSASKSIKLPTVNIDVLLFVFVVITVGVCMDKKLTEGFDCQEDYNPGHYSAILSKCENEDGPCSYDLVNEINGAMECENIPAFVREMSAEHCSNYLNRCQSVEPPAPEPTPPAPGPAKP
jgi:hypothetical protein